MGLISITKYNITCDSCLKFYCEDEEFEGDAETLLDYAQADGWHIAKPGDRYNSPTIYCPECAEKMGLLE